jgi:hypothetical protein
MKKGKIKAKMHLAANGLTQGRDDGDPLVQHTVYGKEHAHKYDNMKDAQLKKRSRSGRAPKIEKKLKFKRNLPLMDVVEMHGVHLADQAHACFIHHRNVKDTLE